MSEEQTVTVSEMVGKGGAAHRLVRVGAWDFTVWEGAGDGEPRIRDLDAGERLGFARPITIRDLIKRIWQGKNRNRIHQIRTARTTSGGRPTKPATEFWLTEAQLLKLCARSETEIADAILDDMIRVYMLARRGLLGASTPAARLSPADVEALALLLLADPQADHHVDHLEQHQSHQAAVDERRADRDALRLELREAADMHAFGRRGRG